MKFVLISAVAASALVTVSSPTFAQSTPAEVAELAVERTSEPMHRADCDQTPMVRSSCTAAQDCRCDAGSVRGARPYDSTDRIARGIERRSRRARASRRRAREPLSCQRHGPRRRQRADADQARDRAQHGLHGQRPPACSIPTPTSPTACAISPAPIALRAAITAAPSATMRAATAAQRAAARDDQRLCRERQPEIARQCSRPHRSAEPVTFGHTAR